MVTMVQQYCCMCVIRSHYNCSHCTHLLTPTPSFLLVALISGIFLYILDATTGGSKMNMSAWGRSKLEKQRKEEEEAAAR